MRSVPNYHHSYTIFLLAFAILILFHPAFSINVSILSSTESLTISGNRTIVSPNDVFELGFFKPATSSRWYLGIWYKKIPEGTFIWVANRDNPLSNSIGTLKFSGSNLVLLDDSDTPVWSTNLTGGDARSSVVAELLANGNFVLRHSNNNKSGEFLWQSFDFPTDTLLPEMKIGWDLKTGFNRFLRSWKSPDDPSKGDFFYKLETRGSSEFHILNQDERMFRSGPWNGIRFNGMPEMQQLSFLVYTLTENREEVTYTFLVTNHSIYSRLTLTPSGSLQQFTWFQTEPGKDIVWTSPKDQCDAYERCGPYSYCSMFTSSKCNCLEGFEQKNLQDAAFTDGTGRCVRKTKLSCSGDGFFRMSNMKLPDTTAAIVDKKIGAEECEKRCRKNCNCTAYASKDVRNGGTGCVIWIGELGDMRRYSSTGQDLYVRLAAADLGRKSNINGKTIGLIVGVCVVLLLSFIVFYFWHRKQKEARKIAAPTGCQERDQDVRKNGIIISSRRHFLEDINTEDLELPLMEFEAVVNATNNFADSNKLGEGGFGSVYKGILLDGKEIAVKRLSKMSFQGINEFKNEVRLIARLHHINLVRLVGCCIDMDEKILIYEYLENRDLTSHIFDKTQSYKLNWQTRFDIANGIARGLLYLHQDSRFRIIHRDLKASNVLLDKDMTPKISDFGMARIFGRDETEANTLKVVGTYGYMSPEYAMDGIFSVKSDVFSFGVLLLEIVSGKKNRGFYNSSQDSNLLSYVWRYWKEGKGLEIADQMIIDSSSSSPLSPFRPQEVLRCIQIGLLCVQERAQDRPSMLSVVFMLGSETAGIPQPKPPAYCVGRSSLETDSSSSEQTDEESWTVNEITISVIDPR